MKRYIVLTDDCISCGHMHRIYDCACDCQYRFSKQGIPSIIAKTVHNLHPIWIDKQLSKIGMKKLKAMLES